MSQQSETNQRTTKEESPESNVVTITTTVSQKGFRFRLCLLMLIFAIVLWRLVSNLVQERNELSLDMIDAVGYLLVCTGAMTIFGVRLLPAEYKLDRVMLAVLGFAYATPGFLMWAGFHHFIRETA